MNAPNHIRLKDYKTLKLLPHELADTIKQAIQNAQTAGDLPTVDIPALEVRPPKNPDQGDYASAVAMQLTKPTGIKNPLDLATIIVKHLPQSELIGAVEIAKPGFI